MRIFALVFCCGHGTLKVRGGFDALTFHDLLLRDDIGL
jgi:hypothetical protein